VIVLRFGPTAMVAVVWTDFRSEMEAENVFEYF